jgi:hypothetical protein
MALFVYCIFIIYGFIGIFETVPKNIRLWEQIKKNTVGTVGKKNTVGKKYKM